MAVRFCIFSKYDYTTKYSFEINLLFVQNFSCALEENLNTRFGLTEISKTNRNDKQRKSKTIAAQKALTGCVPLSAHCSLLCAPVLQKLARRFQGPSGVFAVPGKKRCAHYNM